MAGFLDFLGQASSAISDISGPASQIMGMFKSNKVAQPQRQAVPAAETYAISLLKAIAQPGNSLVKQLAAEELQGLMAGQQSDIRSRVMADRRERAMGRAPVFFDPERADENIAFQLSRGGAGLQQQAQSNAVQRILEAAGVGKYAQAGADRESIYEDRQATRKETMAGMPNVLQRVQTGLEGIGGLQNGLGGLQAALEAINKKKNTVPFGPLEQRYNQMTYNQ